MSDSRNWAFKAALVGEALGRPFVGLRPGRVEQLLGGEPPDGFLASGVLLPERPEKNGVPGVPGGLAQRLMAGLAALVPDDAGRGPAARVAAELVVLAEHGGGAADAAGLLRDPGRPLQRAVARWRQDYPWEDADHFAAEEVSEGIGPAALGLLGLWDPSLPVTLARLTHRRCLAISGAVAVASAIRLCLESSGAKRFDAEGVARAIIADVAAFESRYIAENLRAWKDIGWGRPETLLSSALAPLPSLLREGRDDLAIKTILATAGEHQPENQRPSHVQHGFAAASLPWALFRGLGSLPSRRAVEDVLPRGGESAQVAAIVAALRVARAGSETLPDEWWNGARAVPHADRLLQNPTAESLDAWRRAEAAWYGEEERLRAPLREAIRKQELLDEERARNHGIAPKAKAAQEEAPFAPPPHLWLKDADADDPKNKKILRALRGKKRIDWKEDRRRQQDEPEGE